MRTVDPVCGPYCLGLGGAWPCWGAARGLFSSGPSLPGPCGMELGASHKACAVPLEFSGAALLLFEGGGFIFTHSGNGVPSPRGFRTFSCTRPTLVEHFYIGFWDWNDALIWMRETVPLVTGLAAKTSQLNATKALSYPRLLPSVKPQGVTLPHLLSQAPRLRNPCRRGSWKPGRYCTCFP